MHYRMVESVMGCDGTAGKGRVEGNLPKSRSGGFRIGEKRISRLEGTI